MSEPEDWLEHLKEHTTREHAELDLTQLQPGDIVRVITGHTIYQLEIVEGRRAQLTTSRKDRPSGLVQIHGCTFGMSSTIKPDALFCGGNLEFTFDDGKFVHTTTSIRGLQLVRKR